MSNTEKYWLEGKDGYNNKHHYGMSSALGCTTSDLPTDIPQGSDCFDYSTQTVYFYDGVAWR